MKLLFMGDLMLNHRHNKSEPLFSKSFLKLINSHDISCINFEGPISDDGDIPKEKRGGITRNNESTLHYLKDAGINLLSIANNHIMDYGEEGLRHTLELFDTYEIDYVGAGENTGDIYRLFTFSDENIKVGIISIAEKQFGVGDKNHSGYAWMFAKDTFQLIKKAKRECSKLIVYCHCGAEGLNVPLPEVIDIYRRYIEIGADVVIGSHPHVIQGYERYQEGLIFYSLGNLAFDTEKEGEPFNPEGMIVSIEIDKRAPILYNVYETVYDGVTVDLRENIQHIEESNQIMNDPEKYKIAVEEYCVSMYQLYYRRYFSLIIGFDIDNVEKQKKFLQHRLNGDEILWDDLFIYHNCCIETNRWILEHAVKCLNQDLH